MPPLRLTCTQYMSLLLFRPFAHGLSISRPFCSKFLTGSGKILALTHSPTPAQFSERERRLLTQHCDTDGSGTVIPLLPPTSSAPISQTRADSRSSRLDCPLASCFVSDSELCSEPVFGRRLRWSGQIDYQEFLDKFDQPCNVYERAVAPPTHFKTAPKRQKKAGERDPSPKSPAPPVDPKLVQVLSRTCCHFLARSQTCSCSS